MTQTHGEPTYDHDMNDIANFKVFLFFSQCNILEQMYSTYRVK